LGNKGYFFCRIRKIRAVIPPRKISGNEDSFKCSEMSVTSSKNVVPEMYSDWIPSIDGTWLIIISSAAAVIYPVITVREINLTMYDTFRNPATQRIKPVQINMPGITESADVSRFRPSTVIPREAKIPNKRTAVALVGPKVINLPEPNIPPASAAIPEPSNP